MKSRFVGRTGLQVSELCLGTMTFGADGGTEEATAHQILDAFLDAVQAVAAEVDRTAARWRCAGCCSSRG